VTLAIDAGQTATRAALGGARGGPPATADGVGRLDGGATAADVADALLAAIARLDEPPATGTPTAVGLSGFEAARADQLEEIAARLRAAGLDPVAIAGDGLAALLGALGETPGAVVAAGTGTVALARDGERIARVDGWGALLGDAGSGFAIGRAGLADALREADGRGGSRELLAAARGRFGDAEGVPAAIYGAPSPVRAVAAFAADVAELARAGEPAATAILAGAGRELAISAAAALGRVFEAGAAVAVSHSGNVFAAGAPLTGPFERELAERWPDAVPTEPAGDALAGARLLADLGARLAPVPGILWRPA
jgi:glucosamine kinase